VEYALEVTLGGGRDGEYLCVGAVGELDAREVQRGDDGGAGGGALPVPELHKKLVQVSEEASKDD